MQRVPKEKSKTTRNASSGTGLQAPLPSSLLIRGVSSGQPRRSDGTRKLGGKDQASEEYLVLIGHSPIGEFLGMATVQAVDSRKADQRQLVDEWMTANDRINGLIGWQPGFADSGRVVPIPKDLQRLVSEVEADPIFQRSFSFVKTRFGMVEIDRLVPIQKFVNLSQIRRLRRHLNRSLTPRRIFKLCLPVEPVQPKVNETKVANNSWVFSSRSNDLRFLDAILLGPDQVFGYRPQGPVASVVGLVIGFSSNMVNVVRVGSRMFLGNGTHRVYALRQAGLTHAPCVIQDVTRLEELTLTFAPQQVPIVQQLAQVVRPPVFADFTDALLTKALRLPPFNYQVRVRFEVEGPLGFPYCLTA